MIIFTFLSHFFFFLPVPVAAFEPSTLGLRVEHSTIVPPGNLLLSKTSTFPTNHIVCFPVRLNVFRNFVFRAKFVAPLFSKMNPLF
jgi:hypothetical protein